VREKLFLKTADLGRYGVIRGRFAVNNDSEMRSVETYKNSGLGLIAG